MQKNSIKYNTPQLISTLKNLPIINVILSKYYLLFLKVELRIR